jgi:hypothetical protein
MGLLQPAAQHSRRRQQLHSKLELQPLLLPVVPARDLLA